jgi:diacylglycerol kinase
VKGLLRSFLNAFRGVGISVKSGRNMAIHLCAAAVVTAAGIILRIKPWGWVAVFICFALVIAAEMLNTALERLCDAVSPEQSPKIRDVKDIGAGAVLVCAVFSVCVAVIVFIIS